jgi:hypothetical protein
MQPQLCWVTVPELSDNKCDILFWGEKLPWHLYVIYIHICTTILLQVCLILQAFQSSFSLTLKQCRIICNKYNMAQFQDIHCLILKVIHTDPKSSKFLRCFLNTHRGNLPYYMYEYSNRTSCIYNTFMTIPANL